MKDKKDKKTKIAEKIIKSKGKKIIKKFVLGTVFSVVGLIGAVMLGIYLSGGFSNTPKNPEDLFFANAVISEDGSVSYESRGSTPYNVEGNTELLLSSLTEGVNQTEIELSFPKGQAKYITIVESTEEISESETVKIYYGLNNENERIIFCSCEEKRADYITNGVIIVPRYAQINKSFTAIAVVAPDNQGSEITDETKLYNVGGYTQLIATSTTNKLLSSTSVYLNVDVEVEKIEIIGITADNLSPLTTAGIGEFSLSVNSDKKIEVASEGLFSAILNVTPSRAVYKYGKDGKNGNSLEYKTVVFSLDKDVNNAGTIINFANSNNEVIESSTAEFGKVYTFNEKQTLGTSLLTTSQTGTIKLYAKMFKTASIEDEALASGITKISDYDSKMNEEDKGVRTEQEFIIKEIEINGFTVNGTEIYNNGNPLGFDINRSNVVYANKANYDKNLGITINSEKTGAQNNIKNILISIQFYANGKWYDATQSNEIDSETISKLFNVYEGNQIVTGNALGIETTNSLYNFNFYKSIYSNASNLSRWEIYALPMLENLSTYGINQIRIGVYYLSPEEGKGLILDDEQNYGPYYIECGVNEPVLPVLDWINSDEVKNNVQLGVGGVNERTYISSSSEYVQYNTISIENLVNISNLSANPTYKTIKRFIYTSSEIDLTNYLNVKKYNGTISGITGTIYEINDESYDKLVVSNLDVDEIEFNITFAVVESSYSGSISLYDGAYRIITLPTINGKIAYAPIKIVRSLKTFEVNFKDGTQIYPYGTDTELNIKAAEKYYLQNTEDNVEIGITVEKNDKTLFEKLAKSGQISILDNQDFFCKIGSNKVELSEALLTIFASDSYLSFVTINETEDTAEFVIKLSTKEINFGDLEEKVEKITLKYEIFANNLPYEQKLTTKTTDEIEIYSGKVKEANFGTSDSVVTNISVEKEISDGNFTTNVDSDAIIKGEDKYYLNVYVNGFGYNDSYTVTSSNSNVVSLNWDGAKYAISFVGEGEATLTLNLEYAHKDYVKQTLNISVSSNYITEVNYPATSEDDERILSYSDVLGYQILGKAGANSIDLSKFIRIIAKTSDGLGGYDQTIITNKFTFTVQFDNITALLDKVDIDSAIKINKDFGSTATLIVSVSSLEVGQTYVFNITIKPYTQLSADISSHTGAPKGEGEIGVFAETDIAVENFGIQQYYEGAYSVYVFKEMFYSLISQNGTKHLLTYNDITGKYENEIAELTINGTTLEAITFNNVSGKYVLQISDCENPTVYDLVKEFTFNVSSNIKVKENENVTKVDNSSFGNIVNQTIYYLNNETSPIFNNHEIDFSELNNISFGETEIEFAFERIFGNAPFEESDFTLEVNGEELEDLTYKITNIKVLSQQILTIKYGTNKIYVVYYVAPNIQLKSSVKTVVYDGKEYVSLYAGQVIGDATSWIRFVYPNSASAVITVNFGEIVKDGKILILPKLYALNGTTNLTENGIQYTISKTSDGFILTTIVVTADIDGDKQIRMFDALISPFQWETFLTYSEGITGKDIKDVLSGEVKEEVLSGNSFEFASHVKDVNTFISSSTNRITYKLYKVNAGTSVEVLDSTGIAYINSINGLCLFSQPIAYDQVYRIEFTYTGLAEGCENAVFVFNYYVKLKKTQSIEINYPYLSEKTTTQTVDNISTIFDGNAKQIIYFDQYVNNLYEINLASNLRNYNNSASTYANVAISSGVSDSSKNPNATYNKLHYSIYKVIVDGSEITEDISSYVEINDEGKVTLKKVNKTSIGVIVKITTINGAENYYKILSQARNGMAVSYSSEPVSNLNNIGSNLEIGSSTGLSKFSVAGFDADDLSFAIINQSGKLQTSANNIYISEDNIIVKPTPNTQSAILVIYNEEVGTIAEINLNSPSPISINYNQTATVYGDSAVDLKDFLSGTNAGEDITFDGLTYSIQIENGNEFVLTNSGSSLEISPVSSLKTISGIIKLYGIDGTSQDMQCEIPFTLTLTPRITVKENGRSGSSNANETFNLALNTIFNAEMTGADLTSYKYIASISWNQGTGETIQIPASANIESIEQELSFVISHVASIRTATITITVGKYDTNNNLIGESVSGTYVLTINPIVSVVSNYPSYGTGKIFSKEAIYALQSGTINLLDTARVSVTGGDVEFESSDSDLLSVGSATGVLTITNAGKAISQSKEILISVKIKDTQIVVGAYSILLSPSKVFNAEFANSENADKSQHSEIIADSELPTDNKPFNISDGTIRVELKQNSINYGTISFVVSANRKYEHFAVADLEPVRIYAIGKSTASIAKLYIFNNTNRVELSGVESFNLLGTDDDSTICTLTSGVLTFTQEGIWPIEVTTSVGTGYYYVSVDDSFSPTFYKELTLTNNKLSLSSIFGSIAYEDMYQFSISNETAVGLEMIQSLELVQPYSTIIFSYKVGQESYVIPFGTASTKFTISDTSTTVTNYAFVSADYYNSEYKELEIVDEYGTTVGTYQFKIVSDYKFGEDKVENITVNSDKSISRTTNINTYNSNEFNEFDEETYKVLKTVELTAGTAYNLVSDILVNQLGLTKFNGTAYTKALRLSLDFGDYVSNNNFSGNKSGLISFVPEIISSKTVNYTLTPHGAQNGGDIVHFVLTIGEGEEEYILRIKILPNVTIQSLSVSGDFVINSGEKIASPESAGTKNVYLSDLIYINNVVVDRINVVVIANDSSSYIQGDSANRLIKLTEGTGLGNYGFVLNHTELGGAEIKLKIFDEYGFQVTDTSGTPLTLTIHYKNHEGKSVQVDRSNTSTEIYEGESFEIWGSAKIDNETKYAKYCGNGVWKGSENGTDWTDSVVSEEKFEQLTQGSTCAILVLENMPTSAGKIVGTVTLDEHLNLKNLLEERKGSEAVATVLNKGLESTGVYSINYISNKYFADEEQIQGNNFTIKVVYSGETISFSSTITIKQKYKLVLKDDYNIYDKVYIPVKYEGTSYVKKDYNVKNFFKIVDLKDNSNSVSGLDFNTIAPSQDYKSINNVSFVNKLLVDGDGRWEGTYTLTINTLSITGNNLKFDYQYVLEYFSVDTSDSNIYSTYGLVLSGKVENVQAYNLQNGKVKLSNAYGKTVLVESSYLDASDLSQTFNPGNTISVKIYGDANLHNNSTLIATLNIHRALYTGIEATTGTYLYNLSGSLPFSNGTAGWGDLIKATGTGSTKGALTGTTGGMFSYGILTGSATIVLDETTNEYKIIPGTSETKIQLIVYYMGNSLGFVDLNKDGTGWKIGSVTSNAQVLTFYNGSFTEKGSNTLELNSVEEAVGDIETLYIPSKIKGKDVHLASEIEGLSSYKYIIFPNLTGSTLLTGATKTSKGSNVYLATIGGVSYKATITDESKMTTWAGCYTLNYYNGSTLIATEEIDFGSSITIKAWETGFDSSVRNAYTQKGWKFCGWSGKNANDSCIKVYDDNATIQVLGSGVGEIIKIYAIYSRTITLYSGAEKSSKVELTQYWNPYGATEGTHYSAITLPTPEAISNWTILGYREDTNAEYTGTDDKEYAIDTNIAPENVNLYYAVYKRTLSVSYNKNNGTGSIGNSTKYIYLNSNSATTSDQTITTAVNTFTRIGYTYVNWNTKDDGTGISVNDGIEITNNVAYNAENFGFTLYAIWDANEYTIEYYNGTTFLGSTEHVYDETKKLKSWATWQADPSVNATFADVNWNTFYGWTLRDQTASYSREYTDEQDVLNITPVDEDVVKIYAIYSRDVKAYSNTNASKLSVNQTQYWNPYGTTEGIHYNKITFANTNASISNWTLLGFRDDTDIADKEYALSSSITSSMPKTFYAVYSRDVVVKYLANGASGSMENTTKTIYMNTNSTSNLTNQEVTIKANSFTYGTSTFLYWKDMTAGTTFNPNDTYNPAYVYNASTFTTEITAIWQNTYTVNHYKENIGVTATLTTSNCTLAETESFQTFVKDSISPAVKTYTGFTSPTVITTTLSENGTTINYFYTRNQYTLTLIAGTGITSVSGTGTYDFEQSVSINAVVGTAYDWLEWGRSGTEPGSFSSSTKSQTITMSAGNTTLEAKTTVKRYKITKTRQNSGDATEETKIERTSSPYQGASLCELENNDYIYYGDVLKVTADGGTKTFGSSSYDLYQDVTIYYYSSSGELDYIDYTDQKNGNVIYNNMTVYGNFITYTERNCQYRTVWTGNSDTGWFNHDYGTKTISNSSVIKFYSVDPNSYDSYGYSDKPILVSGKMEFGDPYFTGNYSSYSFSGVSSASFSITYASWTADFTVSLDSNGVNYHGSDRGSYYCKGYLTKVQVYY